MLITGDRLIHSPVLGLQTGGELARTQEAVIDPATLKILAYELEGPLLDLAPALLRVIDIREISEIGLIVDSSDEFVGVDDVISLGQVYKLKFRPSGMKVIDTKKHTLGKVHSYTIHTTDFTIYQLSIKRPFFKSFSDTELLIHRSAITEINNDVIIVKADIETAEPIMDTMRTSYINPFRGSQTSKQPSSNGINRG